MLRVGEGLLAETFTVLRDCGRGADECVVLWTGPLDSQDVVDQVLHPRHSSGWGGYEVSQAWLQDLWIELSDCRRTIRAQVHSHPREAFHSRTDDGFAVVQTAGFLSLVIPDFAEGPLGLDRCYLTEIQSDGTWAEQDPERALCLL